MNMSKNANNENGSTVNNNENYLQHSDGSFSKYANFTLSARNTKPFDISKMTGKAESTQSNNNQTEDKEKEK